MAAPRNSQARRHETELRATEQDRKAKERAKKLLPKLATLKPAEIEVDHVRDGTLTPFESRQRR
jgi:hypothetical protein